MSGRTYDQVWDAIEADYARKPGTALWLEEGIAEVEKQRQKREHEAREQRERERIEAMLRARSGRGGLGDPLARASAYLLACPAGVSGQERNPTAWGVVLRTTRGFALAESTALVLLDSEYAPRCKPKLSQYELRGMVRRALRHPRPAWGYLLERSAA